jgi:hypothetical protein
MLNDDKQMLIHIPHLYRVTRSNINHSNQTNPPNLSTNLHFIYTSQEDHLQKGEKNEKSFVMDQPNLAEMQ